jgi:hypothetical protein
MENTLSAILEFIELNLTEDCSPTDFEKLKKLVIDHVQSIDLYKKNDTHYHVTAILKDGMTTISYIIEKNKLVKELAKGIDAYTKAFI